MNESSVEALIWDVDGTLADTIPIVVDALTITFDRHGGPELNHDEIVARFGPTEEGLLRNELGDEWVRAIETYLVEYERRHDGDAGVFDGVRSIVHQLHGRGIPMAVVTGKGARSAEITLRAIGLDAAFDPVEAGSMEGSVKATAISRIVDAWSIDPRRVAYFGDMPSDIDESRKAGVWAVSVAWKTDADVEALAAGSPDALLRTEDELGAWVSRFVVS